MNDVDVPIDLYESPKEIVIVMPLGGVEKESVSIELQETTLIVSGERVRPELKDSLLPSQEHCFWGKFSQPIELPEDVYFDRIYSELSPTNILTIVVPKVVEPEEITVNIKE